MDTRSNRLRILILSALIFVGAAQAQTPSTFPHVRQFEDRIAQHYSDRGIQKARPHAAAVRTPSAVSSTRHSGTSRHASRLVAGAPGSKDRRVDFSAAHNIVRYFSVDSTFEIGDAALARALTPDRSLTHAGLPGALASYADELPDVDFMHAGTTNLGAARIRVVGDVAVVVPGTGSIVLPPSVEVLVVDLRNLPAVDELKEILPAMIAPALATPVPGQPRLVRVQDGPVDEVYSPFNVYSTSVGMETPAPMPATGTRDLPIVLVVGQTISPQAADFAATLRAAQRAWIAGESVPLAIAESTWHGIDNDGLSVRTSTLLNLIDLPPTILADQVTPVDDAPLPTELSYRHNFTVSPGTAAIKVTMDGTDSSEALLVIMYDANGDGQYLFFDDFLTFSDGPGMFEQVVLTAPAPGNYQAIAWSYFAPAGQTTFTLQIDTTVTDVLPDELAPDLAKSQALGGRHDDVGASGLAALVVGLTPPPVTGPAERSVPLNVSPFGFIHPRDDGRGPLRASLIIAHGATRRFFPYFPIVGDTIDDRLIETLGMADAYDGVERIAAIRILRRFGEALHDGHQFVFNYYPFPFLDDLPVFLDHVEGRPVVRRSLTPGINPGDTIIALEGRPIEDVYAEELARTSAATLGYQIDIANRNIYQMTGPMTLTLEDTYGVPKTVVAPVPNPGEYLSVILPSVSLRPSGPLSDLGAPNIYYLNMDGFSIPNTGAMLAAIAEAGQPGITGMVLDMRGYPSVSAYDVAQRLIPGFFFSPIFEVAQFAGPDGYSLSVEQYFLSEFFVGPPKYSGPIVLLTGPHAVSAAENFMMMLVGADRLLAIVGQQSAGTNGNITGVNLPGDYAFTYTGMSVLFPDGSPFHGTGIQPDVIVPITKEDLRDGIDRDLLTAITLF